LVLAAGFYIGYKDNNFLLNILGEIVGLFLSILVAIFIVDKLINRFKEEEWSRIRKFTHESIAGDLFLLAFNIYIYIYIY